MRLNLDISPTITTNVETPRQALRMNSNMLPLLTEILTRRIYSNPIRVICREILSNAKDAHAAAGCPERPVHVQLPTADHPFLEIEDFGTGISPELMDTLYCEILGSTKREDANAIGGFGLGRLSVFAYTPEFIVVSTYAGVERTYQVILSSNVEEAGAFLIGECAVERPNGFRVVVQIKPQDFESFRNAVAETCEFWPVRPQITPPVTFADRRVMIKGEGWLAYGLDLGKVKLLVGKIPYDAGLREIRSLPPRLKEKLDRLSLVIDLGVDEVKVDVSRERLNYDDATCQSLVTCLGRVVGEYELAVQNRIDACNTLIEATGVYKTLTYNYPHAFRWRGIQLTNYIRLEVGSTRFICYDHNGDRQTARLFAPDSRYSAVLYIQDIKLASITVAWKRRLLSEHPGQEIWLAVPDLESNESFADWLEQMRSSERVQVCAPRWFSECQKVWFPPKPTSPKAKIDRRVSVYQPCSSTSRASSVAWSTRLERIDSKIDAGLLYLPNEQMPPWSICNLNRVEAALGERIYVVNSYNAAKLQNWRRLDQNWEHYTRVALAQVMQASGWWQRFSDLDAAHTFLEQTTGLTYHSDELRVLAEFLYDKNPSLMDSADLPEQLQQVMMRLHVKQEFSVIDLLTKQYLNQVDTDVKIAAENQLDQRYPLLTTGIKAGSAFTMRLKLDEALEYIRFRNAHVQTSLH